MRGGVEVSGEDERFGEPGEVERAGAGVGRPEAVHRLPQEGHCPACVPRVSGGQRQGEVGVALLGGEFLGGDVRGPGCGCIRVDVGEVLD